MNQTFKINYNNYIISISVFLENELYLDESFISCLQTNSIPQKSLDSIYNNQTITAFITDNYSYAQAFDGKVLFCCEDINSQVINKLPFNWTIFIGSKSIVYDCVFPYILHYYNLPDIIYMGKSTPHYLLREYTLSDFDNVYNLFHYDYPKTKTNARQIVDNFMTESKDIELGNFANYLQSYNLFNCGLFGIFINEQLSGQIGLVYHLYECDNSNEMLEYELSYYINQEMRNKGLGELCTKKIINHFYTHHDRSEKIYCRISRHNNSSINFALKLGFKLFNKNNDFNVYVYECG